VGALQNFELELELERDSSVGILRNCALRRDVAMSLVW